MLTDEMYLPLEARTELWHCKPYTLQFKYFFKQGTMKKKLTKAEMKPIIAELEIQQQTCSIRTKKQ